MVFETGKYNDGTGKPLTQTHDETKVLTDFVNEMRNFVHKNNVVSFDKVNIESQFYQTGFPGKRTGGVGSAPSLIKKLAFAKNIEFLSQKVTIEKIDNYGNYSWEVLVSAEIDGEKYSNIDFNTYEVKQYFNAYQILGGFENKIIVDYKSDAKDINYYDREFKSNITLENLGFYWYAHQILDSFNKTNHNKLVLDYINKETISTIPQVKAIGVHQAERDGEDHFFKPASEVNSGHSPNDKILDEYFYVLITSDYSQGIYKLLVKNLTL
ncbi:MULTISPECIES: hypothetical protein [unclassified Spiroplasma]|uniref:hypothetical protein n=1 Tax=unclassified Spiroplasma TaxID=2637901 RepID=UPI0030CBB339